MLGVVYSPLSSYEEIADSTHPHYGESPTLCIIDAESRQLPLSLVRRVVGSLYQ
jgi:hypothetical protein